MILKNIYQINSSKIYLINIEKLNFNDLKVLSDDELICFANLKSEQRKKEYLGTRILLNKILPSSKIKYKKTGKPTISNYNISISHSNNYIAIGINNEFDIGIDLQLIKSKVFDIRSKFLSKKELNRFHLNSEILTELWCIKESCYKLFDDNNLNFKENIEIFQENEEYYSICKLNGLRYKVEFSIFDITNYKLIINNKRFCKI